MTKNPSRTYWRIVVRHHKIEEVTYFWTAEPASPRTVPRLAVREKFLSDVDRRYVSEVQLVTREEYCRHMWE